MTSEGREDDWMAGVAPSVQRTPAEQAERNVDLVWWATWLGLLLAGVAAIAGVTMAVQRKAIECTDDYECVAYPMAAPGVAIAALAGVLAILVVFAGIAARAALRTTEE
ncbi:hypothetical protein [Nocardioides lianchengensis]|uniref:Uncharacterized protein n=1 Tax=Nocardioides lianchengensis TaxID=1045774 RepID=A0A1G6J418_9ACTN|nr:hypothetical protein [Nocardioides lianchengensis]NYG12864.1 hypothetical protein [Nocardioides lianchengensis]SDC13373.1 hypothetical protein SAMN05421872_101363 [Nocardioides lianchengensis]